MYDDGDLFFDIMPLVDKMPSQGRFDTCRLNTRVQTPASILLWVLGPGLTVKSRVVTTVRGWHVTPLCQCCRQGRVQLDGINSDRALTLLLDVGAQTVLAR